MKILETPVMPKGFKCGSVCSGMKEDGKKDLSVFYTNKSADAAGVFTKNYFPGVPVILGREIIKRGKLSAIVANSKISNVGTGEKGVENAEKMAMATSTEFNIPVEEVIMSSTGVIAKQLRIDLIENGIKGISKKMSDNPLVGTEGIMTTDTFPKAVSIKVDNAILTIVGKGAGMIEPNMATMLVYIFTDAKINSKDLDKMLRIAVEDSFNMLSVDTDTSTSDTCLIMANGLSGEVDHDKFLSALKTGSIEMTKMLAADGEGATKLLITNVNGAKNKEEARIVAKSLVNSPLIKTMAYGADPNIGRILMAVGKCFTCEIIPEKIEAYINDNPVYIKGNKAVFDEEKLRETLSGELVEITVALNVGDSGATAYGCDYTEGYIKENASYYSS